MGVSDRHTDDFTSDPIIEIKNTYWKQQDESPGYVEGEFTVKNCFSQPIYNVTVILDMDDTSATWDMWLVDAYGNRLETPRTFEIGTLQPGSTSTKQYYWQETHHIGGPTGGSWQAYTRLIPSYTVDYQGSDAFTSTTDVSASGS